MENCTKEIEASVDYAVASCVPEGRALFPFQVEGVQFLYEKTRCLLASDPGTGKTIMLIVAANVVEKYEYRPAFEGQEKRKVLVLCPKSVVINWEREIARWSMGCDWTVVNWDKLVSPNKARAFAREWDIVIADESHTAIKSPDAKRCRFFLTEIVPKAKRVWLATATPASRTALDYYCTLQVTLPKFMEGWNTWRWQREFCQEQKNPWVPGGKTYTGFKNTPVLKEIFSRCTLRHKKEDVLPQLPPKVYQNIEVELSPKIVAQHFDLDTQELEDYIMSGRPVSSHIAHVMQATAKAKLPYVIELIENFPEEESLVVFAWHRSVVYDLQHELVVKGIPSAAITGESSGAERQRIVDDFQEGRLKRVVCNMAAGGVGINLNRARTCLYVEFPFSPTHLVQSENRVHRIGSVGENVHIMRVMGQGTVDERIWEVLDERIKNIRSVGV